MWISFCSTTTENADASLHQIAAASAATTAADARVKHNETHHNVHHMAAVGAIVGGMHSPTLSHHPYHHLQSKDRNHIGDGIAYHLAKQSTLLPVVVEVGMGAIICLRPVVIGGLPQWLRRAC